MEMNAVASSFDVRRFDYPLPAERIAQEPPRRRDASRLLHLPLAGPPQDKCFTDLPGLLQPRDLVVVNDTTVRAARLLGTDARGASVELLVLRRLDAQSHACLVRPARRLPAGTVVSLPGGLGATLGGSVDGHAGTRAVTFHCSDGEDTDAALERAGRVPLPPYIHQQLDDARRYQTIFAASPPESAAAPTAGLHFTGAVLDRLSQRGIETAAVRLTIGPATFTPIRTERIDGHIMHGEPFELSDAAAEAVRRTRQQGGRVIAAGTTTARVLETCRTDGGNVEARQGVTDLYLRPGCSFGVVDGLLTNFHQPRSSLLVLLAAFVGNDRWREAYDFALAREYRFLSFGDCMLCWRRPQ